MTARSRVALAVLWVGLAGPPALRAQSAETLAQTCSNTGGDSAICGATAVAARAIMADMTLGVGLGSEISGSASNLGQRLGTTPRFTLGARAGMVRMAVPDLFTGDGLGEASFVVRTLSFDVGAGLFDGVRILPTVGGFLALDVYGRLGVAVLPGEEGFSGQNTTYSFGARVGLVRESFTLPGVSVSLTRRFVGDLTFGGNPFLGDPVRVFFGPSANSVRATIGKDVLAFEVLAGFGWDDLSADVSYQVQSGSGPAQTSQTTTLDVSRRMYFLSVARSVNVVFTLSLEAGLADGFDPIVQHVGSFDPGRRTFFGNVAFRLTI